MIEIILVLQIGGGVIFLFAKHDEELNATFIAKIAIFISLILLDKKIKKKIKWDGKSLETNRK